MPSGKTWLNVVWIGEKYSQLEVISDWIAFDGVYGINHDWVGAKYSQLEVISDWIAFDGVYGINHDWSW